MIGRLIYIALKPFFLKHYFNDQSKKSGFENMQKVFIDSNGKQYYSVVNDFDMPNERTKAIEKGVMRLKAGLSGEEDKKIKEAMRTALNNGKKPDIAMIGFCLTEMDKREELLLHPDVMMDIIANRYIREDEDPFIIDLEIHKEKVKQFWLDGKGGLYDFFYKAGLSRYIPYLEKLESDWDEYMLNSTIKIQALENVLVAYTTE